MQMKFLAVALIGMVCGLAGCKAKPGPTTAVQSKAMLGIRPHGDETVAPDKSKVPPDLAKAFDYIDQHIDEHVVNLQKWIQQPSISSRGEGITRRRARGKGFLD